MVSESSAGSGVCGGIGSEVRSGVFLLDLTSFWLPVALFFLLSTILLIWAAVVSAVNAIFQPSSVDVSRVDSALLIKSLTLKWIFIFISII